MMTKVNLVEKFQTIFETEQTPETFFAPGRINLIGEHTDYNGGHVFPAALSFGTHALGLKRSDQKLRFYSLNFPDLGVIETNLDTLDFKETDNWANYPKGMIKYIRQQYDGISTGADILYYGEIPNSAGLSSSASIEMATGVLLEGLFNLDVDRIEMIKIGQKVENEYLGINSGIMDQFAIGMGKADHAILLDCQTLDYDYAPIQLADHVIMIINTNKQRTLSGSKYNERRNECHQALQDLQVELDIEDLGSISPDTFEEHKHLIKDPVHQKRAKHAVYENARTIEALQKLNENDLEAFGQLMNASHISLQEDYEVTGLELDTIAQAAWDQPGVLGARMTGAGFGGCAIALVQEDKAADIKEKIKETYLQKTGIDASFYTAKIGDGARKL